MPTCGFIKVQPDGLKEKAAKSLQKWDPVSKRMVILNPRREPTVSGFTISRISGTTNLMIRWFTYAEWCDEEPFIVKLEIFQSTNPDGSSPTIVQTIQTIDKSYILVNPTREFYYYAVVTSPEGRITTSNILTYGSIISTIAGTGIVGFSGDGFPATAAQLNAPRDIAVDSDGNLYIADSTNRRIRKISVSTGNISTIASGIALPFKVAVDYLGNVYIADTLFNVIRKVSASTGAVAIFAGFIGGFGSGRGFSGDGGVATAARIDDPFDVAVDSDGNLYIADTNNSRIRKVDVSTNIITTIAGGGSPPDGLGDGGAATSARLSSPRGVEVDSSGNVYIVDTGNQRIRKITGTTITTISEISSGMGESFNVGIDYFGNVYITDTSFSVIRKIAASTGAVTTISGNFGPGGFSGDGGIAISAQLSSPRGIAVDSAGNIFIADTNNNRIRKIIPFS